MSEKSYSPKYFQSVIWCAEYLDGSILREWDEEGAVHPFQEIEKSKLSKFHFISQDFDYFFDCKTGIFVVDNREFVFPLAGLELNYGDGLIQYKDATTEFVSASAKTGDYDGFEINDFNMGWKVTHGSMKSQVILTLPQKYFTIELTFLDIQKTMKWKVKL